MPEASVVRVDDVAMGADLALSAAGEWRAFVVHPTVEPDERLRFETARGDQRYELWGLPLPERPLSGLVWLDGDRLAFDRWSQPHYGIHYVVDVRRRRLILAAAFPDAVFPPR